MIRRANLLAVRDKHVANLFYLVDLLKNITVLALTVILDLIGSESGSESRR